MTTGIDTSPERAVLAELLSWVPAEQRPAALDAAMHRADATPGAAIMGQALDLMRREWQQPARTWDGEDDGA